MKNVKVFNFFFVPENFIAELAILPDKFSDSDKYAESF